MREIRTIEMEHDEPAAAWRVASPLAVTVTAGQLWLTVEHDSEDYWLEAGQSFVLQAGARAWLGAGREGMQVALTHAEARARANVVPRRQRWLPRWLQAVRASLA